MRVIRLIDNNSQGVTLGFTASSAALVVVMCDIHDYVYHEINDGNI